MTTATKGRSGLAALIGVFVLVGIMWLLEAFDAVIPGDLDGYGIESRESDGLIALTIIGIGGLGVWLLGPSNTVMVGASGVVFGFLTFLLTAGVLTRHWLDVAIALGVLFLYGGILIGALPFGVEAGVSWLGHLMGAAAGILAAFLFARKADRVVHVPQ